MQLFQRIVVDSRPPYGFQTQSVPNGKSLDHYEVSIQLVGNTKVNLSPVLYTSIIPNPYF